MPPRHGGRAGADSGGAHPARPHLVHERHRAQEAVDVVTRAFGRVVATQRVVCRPEQLPLPQRRVHLGRGGWAEPVAVVKLDREHAATAPRHAPAAFRHHSFGRLIVVPGAPPPARRRVRAARAAPARAKDAATMTLPLYRSPRVVTDQQRTTVAARSAVAARLRRCAKQAEPQRAAGRYPPCVLDARQDCSGDLKSHAKFTGPVNP